MASDDSDNGGYAGDAESFQAENLIQDLFDSVSIYVSLSKLATTKLLVCFHVKE